LFTFITRTARARIVARRRMEAARQVLATFDPEDIPTAEDRDALLALWVSPRTAPARPTRRRPRR